MFFKGQDSGRPEEAVQQISSGWVQDELRQQQQQWQQQESQLFIQGRLERAERNYKIVANKAPYKNFQKSRIFVQKGLSLMKK